MAILVSVSPFSTVYGTEGVVAAAPSVLGVLVNWDDIAERGAGNFFGEVESSWCAVPP